MAKTSFAVSLLFNKYTAGTELDSFITPLVFDVTIPEQLDFALATVRKSGMTLVAIVNNAGGCCGL